MLLDAARLEKLEEDNRALREDLEILREDHEYVEKQLEKASSSSVKVTGFLDVGFFAMAGETGGLQTDMGHEQFPEFMGQIPDSWVFLGDPLSVMINARGEPATTGDSLAIKFDAIDTHTSSFLVNSLNLGLFAPVGEKGVFTTKLDVVPRGRDVSNPTGLFLGDYVDLRLAYFEYRLEKGPAKLDLFVGKFDSVVGVEYRTQEAPTRVEVTPSLICRYTCGFPIGVKARARFFDDAIVLNTAVTNGSQFTENFALYNEIDRNEFKTISSRLSFKPPFLRELEIGGSAAIGAQDNQPDESILQWLVGADLTYTRHNVILRAEFIKGRAKGKSDDTRCGEAECLEFQGAYGLLGIRANNIAMPYIRIDWRDALHRSGAEFVYISQVMRATFGLNLRIFENLIVKGEYTVNQELGRIPVVANDVFTTSLVVKY